MKSWKIVKNLIGKRKGNTLAEMLISLVLIGVVLWKLDVHTALYHVDISKLWAPQVAQWLKNLPAVQET